MTRKINLVSKKDLDIEEFCTGGPGGQKQNRKKMGRRIRHRASGAVGECREHKSAEQNKRAAFRRMTETKEFKAWMRIQIARISGQEAEIESAVEKQMEPRNLKVEVRRDNGTWRAEDE